MNVDVVVFVLVVVVCSFFFFFFTFSFFFSPYSKRVNFVMSELLDGDAYRVCTAPDSS